MKEENKSLRGFNEKINLRRMRMNYNMKKCGEKLKLIQNRWKVVKTWTKVLRES
jgi:hypothetical protein